MKGSDEVLVVEVEMVKSNLCCCLKDDKMGMKYLWVFFETLFLGWCRMQIVPKLRN